LPNLITSEGRIKIKGSDNIFFDINNHDFTIGDVGISHSKKHTDLLTLYPNPARTQVTLKHFGSETAKVTIRDLSGKILWTGAIEQQKTIPTTHWSRGIYIVQLKKKKTTITEKL